MFQLDMLMVLLQPDVDGMIWVANVNLTTLTGDIVYS
jgi:hypothetical protein